MRNPSEKGLSPLEKGYCCGRDLVSRWPPLGADYLGALLAVLCMVHCLALPLMALFAPFCASYFKQEAFHFLMLIMVPILGAFAFIRRPVAIATRSLALVGLLFLVGGVLMDSHDVGIAATVCGSLLFLGAHLSNILRLKIKVA
tara:strand:+ start:189 stop:620 length:432 start_codon:yes stop_codon:yes gene_type:complete